jgi:putative SOS response-associated peptidase YedK
MCGRFTLTDPDANIAVQFGLPEIPDMQPRYNIAPTQPVAAVRLKAGDKTREMVMLNWGLIPSWAKDPKIGSRMINARSETAAQKPSFRTAFRRRRCLVIADGFYEWQKQNGTKQPIFIHLRDMRPFAFAGLWEHWEGPDASVIESCTLLTTEPNDFLRPVHNRMPEIQQPDLIQPLLRPYPAQEMDAYAVSRFVNRPGNDTAKCIEPLADVEDQRLPGF